MNSIEKPRSRRSAASRFKQLRLHRHVEPGHDLVGDQNARHGAERARDVDALALPAGQLRRKARRGLGRQADLAQQQAGAREPLLPGRDGPRPRAAGSRCWRRGGAD